jgi:adenylate cyclase
VADYSRLIGMGDEGTLAQLNGIMPSSLAQAYRAPRAHHENNRRRLVGPVCQRRRCVALCRGDPTRDGATQCPATARSADRIQDGVNVGDIVEGASIHGAGSNVAARLKAMADAGGICLSSRVQEDAQGSLRRLGIAFKDIGQHQLKNIAQVVHVYRILLEQTATKAGSSLAIPDRPSIAVLPVQNKSDAAEQEYFADGMVACDQSIPLCASPT